MRRFADPPGPGEASPRGTSPCRRRGSRGGPGPGRELRQDAPHVRLDGRLAEVQPGPDLGVREPPDDEAHDLAFTVVSSSSPAVARCWRARATKRSIRRRVTVGASSALPAATARTAPTISAAVESLSRRCSRRPGGQRRRIRRGRTWSARSSADPVPIGERPRSGGSPAHRPGWHPDVH